MLIVPPFSSLRPVCKRASLVSGNVSNNKYQYPLSFLDYLKWNLIICLFFVSISLAISFFVPSLSVSPSHLLLSFLASVWISMFFFLFFFCNQYFYGHIFLRSWFLWALLANKFACTDFWLMPNYVLVKAGSGFFCCISSV